MSNRKTKAEPTKETAIVGNTMLPAFFLDGNGNELKKGDKVMMTF